MFGASRTVLIQIRTWISQSKRRHFWIRTLNPGRYLIEDRRLTKERPAPFSNPHEWILYYAQGQTSDKGQTPVNTRETKKNQTGFQLAVGRAERQPLQRSFMFQKSLPTSIILTSLMMAHWVTQNCYRLTLPKLQNCNANVTSWQTCRLTIFEFQIITQTSPAFNELFSHACIDWFKFEK